jgi:hypothetical protein
VQRAAQMSAADQHEPVSGFGVPVSPRTQALEVGDVKVVHELDALVGREQPFGQARQQRPEIDAVGVRLQRLQREAGRGGIDVDVPKRVALGADMAAREAVVRVPAYGHHLAIDVLDLQPTRRVANLAAVPGRMQGFATLLVTACVTVGLAVPADAVRTSPKKGMWAPSTSPRSDFAMFKRLGVGLVSFRMPWYWVALARPLEPRNPADLGYRWLPEIDEGVREASRRGLRIAVEVQGSPPWANGHRERTFYP